MPKPSRHQGSGGSRRRMTPAFSGLSHAVERMMGTLVDRLPQNSQSQYDWKPTATWPTAKDALAIVTPLPNGDSIVGYPTLATPDQPLPLFQLQPSGDPFVQADLARLVPPGEIAIMVGGYYPDLHSNEIPHKRNMGHACLGVGVRRSPSDSTPGVMTINNPQGYLGGAFSGDYNYGCFFIQKLVFPPGITAAEEAAYKKNIVTLTAIANTFIPFAAGNFNGEDPLGIHNFARIQEAGEKLILAVYGDEDARRWLKAPENTAYCAELTSAGINTGAAVPLTQKFIEQLRQRLVMEQGGDRYADLYPVVRQAIDSGSFLAGNQNPNVAALKQVVGMVDEGIDLNPIHMRFPDADRSGTGLAFMYYDFVDIAYGSIRDTYPRRGMAKLSGANLAETQAYNAQVAKVQADAFRQTAERFKGLANLDAATAAAFDAYVEQEVVPALSQVYDSEAARDRHIDQLLEKGRQFTPTGPNGEGMFIPPDLYLMPTEGWADLVNVGLAFFPEHLRRKP